MSTIEVELANEFASFVSDALAPIIKRLDTLEERLAGLERRRSLKFVGVWQSGHAFADQECVTFQGAMWTAVRDTTQMPGTADSGWVLSAKSGRDGKNGKDGKDAA